jgi:hypothetical protein
MIEGGAMTYVVLALAAGLCILCIRLTGLVAQARTIMSDSRHAFEVMRAPNLSEDEKEHALQRASLRMFADLGMVLLQTTAVLAVPVLFVLAWTMVGHPTLAEIEAAAMSWPFILGTTAVMLLFWRFIR